MRLPATRIATAVKFQLRPSAAGCDRHVIQEKEIAELEAELKDWADPAAKRLRLANFSKSIEDLVTQARFVRVQAYV